MKMPNIVRIEDDLDLAKIQRSGQCFRVSVSNDGLYRFIAKDRVLYIRNIDDGLYEVSCDDDEWTAFWHTYFDLGKDYASARARCKGIYPFIDDAMEFGKGIRILNQDPWEMLVTFIISQRKNMPAIATCVETLSARFGKPMQDFCDPRLMGWDGTPFAGIGNSPALEGSFERPGATIPPIHAFPTSHELSKVSEDSLRDCSLGYRAPYVLDAARIVDAGSLDLVACASLEDDELVVELKRVRGVGDKVANCIALFGYGRLGNVPVDVWINRAIDEECGGCDPFARFGADAGLMQQYVFYYMTQRERP